MARKSKKRPSAKHSASDPNGSNHQPKTRKLRILTSAASFDRHLQRVTEMSDHISEKYALTPEERELAFMAALALPQNSIIVELGVGFGKTAAHLIYASKVTHSTYHGIDHFGMDGMSLESVKRDLDQLGVDNYKLYPQYTSDVHWPLHNIDYLLFDAGHDELNMRTDTAKWIPLVKPGGLVLFHAYNPDSDIFDAHFPVKRYADEYTKDWPQIEYIPSLLIRQKPF